MKHLNTLTLLTAALLLVGSSFAQGKIDTIYYDSQWREAPHPTFADFYRIVYYSTNNSETQQNGLFRDFYITGELRQSGAFISIDRSNDSLSVFDGQCITYYKNGNEQSTVNWQGGKRNGEFYQYFENGFVKQRGYYRDDRLNGIRTEFLDNGDFVQEEYLDGRPRYDYYVVGNSRGQAIKVRYSDGSTIWETPSETECKTHFRDGTQWQYYEKNGLIITQTHSVKNDYGKWHKVELIITNNSMEPIEIDPPKDILSYSVDKKGIRTPLTVWSFDNYMKKVKNAQTWEAIAVGVAEGVSEVNAGYRVSHTTIKNEDGSKTVSKTVSYDSFAAYQAQVLASQRMLDFANAQWQERQSKQLGYIKRNTIYPGETVQGYIYINRIKFDTIFLSININNAHYKYSWKYVK